MTVRTRLFLRVGGLLLAAVAIVLLAQWLRAMPAVQAFEVQYPGEMPTALPAPEGIPAWLAWQHYLNALFLVLIARSALTLRSKERPSAFFRRRNAGLIRTANPPRRLGVYLWLHLSMDALWVLNGLIYVVLLFATGYWLRLVPTDWAVVPNAVTAGLQYASLQWPTDDGWAGYNALQALSYFAIVFMASPLAIITGLRLSPAWPLEASLNRWLPEKPVRALHNFTLWAFIVFVIVHVTLVLGTGALRNLNVMYAGNNGDSWLGAAIAALAAASMLLLWLAARPEPVRKVAALFGEVK